MAENKTSHGPLRVAGTQILGGKRNPDREYKVKPYDFRRPDKFSFHQIRTFSLVHETLAGTLRSCLAGALRCGVDVSVDRVDQMRLDEFIDALPSPGAFITLTADPLPGGIVAWIDGPLAERVIHAACGHVAASGPAPGRKQPFSEIERRILSYAFVDALPGMITDAWRRVLDLEPRVEAIETDCRNAVLVPPSDMVITCEQSVIHNDWSASIRWAVPYLTVEPVMDRMTPERWREARNASRTATTVGDAALRVPIEWEVSIPLDGIPISAVPGFLAGEPLPLPSRDEGLVELSNAGVPVARVDSSALAAGGHSVELPVTSAPGWITTRAAGREEKRDGETARIGRTTELLSRELSTGIRDLRVLLEDLRQERDVSEGNAFLHVSGDHGDVGNDRGMSAEQFPNETAALLASEPAEIVAFCIAPLEKQTAARVFSALPANRRAETARAIAAMGPADGRLHRLVMELLSRSIRNSRAYGVAGGPEAVARILNHTPRNIEKEVMETFQTENPPLFESIARLMFVFEDFLLVDPSAIAKLAARVEPDELALAMKGVPGEVIAHIMNALSDETATAIEQADAALGRVRRSDVEAAQREIIEELRALEHEGSVVIARPEDVME